MASDDQAPSGDQNKDKDRKENQNQNRNLDTADHSDPGLEPLVEQAVDDLVQRLSLEDRTVVTVRSAVLTTWSDRGFANSAGLRQTQVPVDGSEIVLEHDGRIYRYRTGGHRYVPTLYS